jgi:hypothetical protein
MGFGAFRAAVCRMVNFESQVCKMESLSSVWRLSVPVS